MLFTIGISEEREKHDERSPTPSTDMIDPDEDIE
jgi:hypothetical protein